jgi:hypothetical protein
MSATSLGNAIEGSTYVVTASFTDESGNAVTPNTVTWTLTSKGGTVINSREDVSETPGTSVDIVLTGDDLAIGSNGQQRILTVNAVYDSSYGTDLPLKGRCTFTVEDLVAVT